MKTKERFRLPPLVTSSNWLTLWSSLHDAARRARGGDDYPRLTNREAVALVAGFRELAKPTSEGWPLWYQFAAPAYGWDPTGDRFVTSERNADARYPDDATRELWEATKRIATNLEEEQPRREPRFELSRFRIADLDFQGDVRQALIHDGAKATPAIGQPSSAPAPANKPTRSPKRDGRTTFVLVALALGGLYLATRRKPRRRRRTAPARRKSHAHAA